MSDSAPNVELHTSNDVLENSIGPAYAVSTQTITGPEPKAKSNQRQPKSTKECFTAKPGESAVISIIKSRRDKRKEKQGRRRRNRAQQREDYIERLVAQHTHDEIRILHLKQQINSRWRQDAEFLAHKLHSRARSV
ncbi:hypothetical protein N7508_007469 [Penicillium antarcticum]|nr:uncharacterized protein N7508_007469 [Penicillium antarcticum]KAJ5300226.1 hypothetical protein N7508_007469 [Penicillium antarcticum]